jgi:hypothetical protein
MAYALALWLAEALEALQKLSFFKLLLDRGWMEPIAMVLSPLIGAPKLP